MSYAGSFPHRCYACVGLFVLFAGAFHLFPQRYTPSNGFAAPWLPWVPASGIMMNGFLIGTLSQYAYLFWAICMGAAIIIYLAYGA